jgi:SAM-dependent methyltransferase
VTLAKAIPDGHVTATDVNRNILPRAQAIAESANVKNIDFREADGYKLPFADGCFDVTHCHQVLCHLKSPWDILREMFRVTKPGGLVAAREGDYETECLWPEMPGLVKFHGLIVRFMKAAGGSPTAGRRLLSWALMAGAQRDQTSASFGTWGYFEPGEKQIWGECLSCPSCGYT